MKNELDKKDCFAYIDEKTCNALCTKQCKDCSFYKPKKDVPNYEKYIEKRLKRKEVKNGNWN